jgi:hypothetical protein
VEIKDIEERLRTEDYVQIPLRSLSMPRRSYKMHDESVKLDVIRVKDSEMSNTGSLFILETLEHGFRIAEMVKEIINLVAHCDSCEFLQHNYDPDSKRLVI